MSSWCQTDFLYAFLENEYFTKWHNTEYELWCPNMNSIAVMVTTKNRCDELARTLDKIQSLSPTVDEIMVVADGCTDGTIDLVRKHDSRIKLLVNEVSIGSVASRAKMMNEANSDIVLALDDDSYPEQLDCVAIIREIFEADELLAVATFPQRSDEYPESLKQTNFGRQRLVRSFPNSGAAIRVSVYQRLPGFERMFFHMYEEPDFALQCIGNGWNLKYFPCITIRHHWTSQQRSQLRNHHRHARNELWSTVMRCPFPLLIGICLYRVFSQFVFSYRHGGLSWLVREPVWWLQALRGLPLAIKRRTPVSWAGYRKWLMAPDY